MSIHNSNIAEDVKVMMLKGEKGDPTPPTDEQVAEALSENRGTLIDPWLESNVDDLVDNWLDEHPEATTTVDCEIFTKVFPTVADMVADATLSVDDKVKTIGYYANRAGGGHYIIGAAPSFASNDYISIPLNNGLYANLVIDGNTVYAEQIGCKAEDNTFDNSIPINKIADNTDFYDTTIIFATAKYYFQHSIKNKRGCVLLGEDVNWNNFGDNNPKLIFQSVDYNDSAIYCQSGCMVKNLFIVGEFETITEDRTLIGTVTDEENTTWLERTTLVADTIGIEMYSNFNSLVENCVIQGFGTGLHLGSACYCVNTAFYQCGAGVLCNNDNRLAGLRFERCGSGIYCINLNTIDNIRCDSVLTNLITLSGYSNIVSNIAGDYVGRSVVYVGNTDNNVSNVTGRCGINFIGVTATLTETECLRNALITLYNATGSNVTNIDCKREILDDGQSTVNVIFAVGNGVRMYLQGVSRSDTISDLSEYVYLASGGYNFFRLLLSPHEYVYIANDYHKVPNAFDVYDSRVTGSNISGELYNQKQLNQAVVYGYFSLTNAVAANSPIVTLPYVPKRKTLVIFRGSGSLQYGYIDTDGNLYSETQSFASGTFIFINQVYITNANF